MMFFLGGGWGRDEKGLMFADSLRKFKNFFMLTNFRTRQAAIDAKPIAVISKI